MTLTEMAIAWSKAQEPKMTKLNASMHRSDRYKKYGVDRNTPGIYFLYIKDTDTCVYIGETGNCILSRLRNHRHSMNYPDWIVEKTGRVFDQAGISDEEFDVFYILADDLEAENKAELTYAQDTFIQAYKPVGNWSKSGSKNV